MNLWHPAPRAPFFNHLFPQVYINSNINEPPLLKFWRSFDPKYQMMFEYATTNSYPSVSSFVSIFLLARQNHDPVHICYTYTIDDKRQFNDQFTEVLQEVSRVNKFTSHELKLYYWQEQDVILGKIACGAATEAVESAKNLFPLQSPSRDEFVIKVYYHTYNQVIDERWRLSRDFIDAMMREDIIASLSSLI